MLTNSLANVGSIKTQKRIGEIKMVTYNEFMEIISDNKVATTQEQYDITTQTITSVFELIQRYINKHGEIEVT